MQLSDAGLAYLAQRDDTVHRWLVWIEAKNRQTGLAEHVGFWSGADDRTFTIEGVERPYIGIGKLLRIASITHQPGPVVRLQAVELLGFSDQIEQAITQYDSRQARADYHLALFDPETMNLVSIEKAGRGWLDKAPVRFGGVRAPSGVRATIASVSRLLTKGLPHKKSNEAQKRRLANGSPDAFRKYGSISGAVPVWWGEQKSVPVEASTPAEPSISAWDSER